MILELSPDQDLARKLLMDWFMAKNHRQYITLGGYAGTGKTTLLAYIRAELKKERKKLKVAFCSYTGKAVQTLKRKLGEHDALKFGDEVRTIHSLIYKAITNEFGAIIGWKKREVLDAEPDLLIVDEASMVDGDIWRDLLSYGIPIIAVGDHGQLPPVSGSFNLMQNPELRLEKIHRQAENNPIIKLSVMARETGFIGHGDYGGRVFKATPADASVMLENIFCNFSADQLILCGYNSTRVRLNMAIRTALGFETPEPRPNDRVICLRNNREKEIYNGMLGYIKGIKKLVGDRYKLEVALDSAEGKQLYTGHVSAEQFGAQKTLNNILGYTKTKDLDLFDFGYALTVHKAQGSQAKKVVVFEERFSRDTEEDWRRWLYTAVTRAEEELLIVGN